MMRFVREFRLIPVVLLAISCLLGLKILGLALDGGFTLADLDFSGPPSTASTPPADERHKTSWAQEMFNFPDVTGSISAEKPAPARQGANEQVAQNAAPPAETKPAEVKPGESQHRERPRPPSRTTPKRIRAAG